jgi:hypothetical protein
MTRVVFPAAAGWRAMASRGFSDLSPPEAEHAMLELPTNRGDYVGILQDIGDYPGRSVFGQRVPADTEVDALKKLAGRWRAIVLLDDERALRTAAGLFSRLYLLDPFYDTGALLYAAFHDPLIKDEHSRRLARQAGLLVRAAPLLNAGTAVLTPEHLPGSWNPRPGWRKPGPTDDRRQHAAWSMRTSLVLLYWADRLDGVVCTAQRDIMAALDVALGPAAHSRTLEVPEARRIDEAQAARMAAGPGLADRWAAMRRLSRRRALSRLEDVASTLTDVAEALGHDGKPRSWRLTLGGTSLPDPAFLLRRVLNGEDPERQPALARKKISRRPLALMPGFEPLA